MPSIRSTFAALAVVGAVIASAAVLTSRPAAAETMLLAPQAQPVAIIDINKVLNKLDEKEAREKELQGYFKTLGDSLEATKKDLDTTRDSLQILPQNTPDFDAAREKVVRLTAKLRLDQEMSQALADERRMRMQLSLFNKIRSATQRLSKKEGYALVFSDDSNVEIPATATAEQIQAGVISRRLIYADAAVDISEQVATMMNNEYKTAPKQ